MKKIILSSLVVFSLAACKKESAISPKGTTTTPVSTTIVPTTVAKVDTDTIPDKSAFKIKLVKDNINSDETMLAFNHQASSTYSPNNDAPYLQGFGQVSLASISTDGVDLAINEMPYAPGMSVGLDVHAKTDGAYQLEISYEHTMPANIQIWLKDNYKKDSVNMCLKKYTFNVLAADTNSFGNKRFKLILKDSSH